ncbi:MAG TPA: hypothetical protein VFC58_04030 [Desulfosporosinus sp.]|nr:hypothetical protein [Desulfosporosinus sp.]
MYFITALAELDRRSRTRCFGYYVDKDEAITAVKENGCYLSLGIYNYIAIEKVAQGIRSRTKEETWFKWI